MPSALDRRVGTGARACPCAFLVEVAVGDTVGPYEVREQTR
jgi:hypothetical protein